MDGIADALVAAQQLVTKLMAERQFKLMVSTFIYTHTSL